MGAFEVVSGRVTNAGVGVMTALTMSPGDFTAVRNFPDSAAAWLEEVTVRRATAGAVRVRSPLLHDNVQGLRWQTGTGTQAWLLGPAFAQRLYPQDTLVIEADSGAADSSVVVAGIYYDQLPGVGQRLVQWGDIAGIIESYKVLEVDTTASATIGAWGSTAITATQDLLKANRDYAVLGYLTDVACAGVAIQGVDTGNLRIGGPGDVLNYADGDYFIKLSQARGKPFIPVINSANKGTTNVAVSDNAAGTAVKVSLVLALLSGSPGV